MEGNQGASANGALGLEPAAFSAWDRQHIDIHRQLAVSAAHCRLLLQRLGGQSFSIERFSHQIRKSRALIAAHRCAEALFELQELRALLLGHMVLAETGKEGGVDAALDVLRRIEPRAHPAVVEGPRTPEVLRPLHSLAIRGTSPLESTEEDPSPHDSNGSRRKLNVVRIGVMLVSVFLIVTALSAVVDEAQADAVSASFDWSMVPRYMPDRNGDSVLDEDFRYASFMYDPCYLNPDDPPPGSGCSAYPWSVTLDASRSIGQGLTYSWSVPDAVCDAYDASAVTCSFPRLARLDTDHSYPVTLTVTDSAGSSDSITGHITLNDVLMVSIGDSFASGEGNPDVRRITQICNSTPTRCEQDLPGFNCISIGIVSLCIRPEVWQDRRCHRSARSAPALAAWDVEARDPHSSVTFLHLACSGAGIDKGLLNPYEGQDSGGQMAYNPPLMDGNLPPQVDEVARLIHGRKIDTLMLSIGANDAGFGMIAKFCAVLPKCYDLSGAAKAAMGSSDAISGAVRDAIADLSRKFNDLHTAIDSKLTVGAVYITEYHDPTRDDSGNYCHMLRGVDEMALDMLEQLLGWIVLGAVVLSLLLPIVTAVIGTIGILGAAYLLFVEHWFDGVTPDESKWAFNNVLLPLNQHVFEAARDFGWFYVGGIMKASRTHGHCAENRWVVRLKDSPETQGDIDGTLHPNEQGHGFIRGRLVKFITEGPEAAFLAVRANVLLFLITLGILLELSEEGDNGWLVGTCTRSLFDGATCDSNSAVISVYAVDPNGIDGTSLSVDGVPVAYRDSELGPPFLDCSVGGEIACVFLSDPRLIVWTIRINADGVHTFGFTVRNSVQISTTITEEVKVDLHDPVAEPALVVGTSGANGWFRSPVEVTLTGTDSPGGSGLLGVEFSIHSTLGSIVSLSERLDYPRTILSIAGDGIHELSFDAVDFAGRRSAPASLQLSIDGTPPETMLRSAVDESGTTVASGGYSVFETTTFAFEGSDATSGVAGFECNVDGTGFAPCASPFSVLLSPGSHTLEVRAVDAAGNADQTPESFVWTILTPSGAAQHLSDVVASFSLPHSTENALLSSLKSIIRILSDGNVRNDASACPALANFIKLVDKDEENGRLTSDQANQLRPLAIELRLKLGC